LINYIILIVSALLLGLYIWDLRGNKFNTKLIVLVGIFSGISYVLYVIQFIKYPQGGGISLFSMLPVMLLSLLCGRQAGLTAGMIFGLLKILNGFFVVHPAQFLLDYILSTMALGLARTFGTDKKHKVILGCLFAVSLGVFINIVSGAVYFGEYAPEGMNVWWYSFIYNFSSAGVEGILTVIVVAVLPLNKFRKMIKL